VYKWRDGKRPLLAKKSVDAQVAGETLEAIREKAGAITPHNVVDESRPSNAPLHPYFEWDDTVAAEQWRLEQARGLIQSVVVVFSEGPAVGRETRAFVSLSRENSPTPAYYPIAVALSDEDMRRRVVANALAELKEWRKRHSELNELAGIFAAIE